MEECGRLQLEVTTAAVALKLLNIELNKLARMCNTNMQSYLSLSTIVLCESVREKTVHAHSMVVSVGLAALGLTIMHDCAPDRV